MYRIITEKVNQEQIANILYELDLDFTAYPATGSWKGVVEDSLVIELSGATLPEVLLAADRIRELNNQEAVLVQNIASSEILVEEGKATSLLVKRG